MIFDEAEKFIKKNKFEEEFEKLSGGKYSVLKFGGAEFFRGKKELVVAFNVSAYDIKHLTDDQRDDIKNIVQSLFPGISVAVRFNRTYADEKIVKQKIVGFLNSERQMYLIMLKPDSISVTVGEGAISVVIALGTPAHLMFKNAGVDVEIWEHLKKQFTEDVEVSLSEIPVDPKACDGGENIFADNVVYVEDARLISAKCGEFVYSARTKPEQITTLPSYISDVKNPCENIVLCGKIFDISEKQYKNKDFDKKDPESPEFKTLFRFRLFDQTAAIECVAFPKPKACEAFRALKNNDEIICRGRITESKYDGANSFVVSTVYRAENIDYSTIRAHLSKPAPSFYQFISPKVYKEMTLYEVSMEEVDAQEVETKEEVPSFLAGKSYVVFDLETTGLDTSSCKIIEIAGVKIVDGKITHTFDTLINPQMPIPEEITRVTGISDKDVERAPTAEIVLPDFFKFTRECALVAHNIGFDFPILNRMTEPLGYVYQNDLYDTVALARQYFPEIKSYKLERLTEYFGITHTGAHRALSDALATAALFKLIAKQKDRKSADEEAAG